MKKVGFGCCVGSWDRFAKNVVPFAGDRQVIGVSGQDSIGSAYNKIMDAFLGHDLDMLILQHDDLEITDPLAIEKFAKAFEDPWVGIAGVAGGSSSNGLAWWTASPVGHVQADPMMVDFGQRSGEVDLLEGCILAFPGWSIDSLRFTPRLGFHGYDCDISMECRSLEMKNVVVDVDVHHHTNLGFDSQKSHADWLDADQGFRRKWHAQLSA